MLSVKIWRSVFRFPQGPVDFFFNSKGLYPLWGPPSILFNWCRSLYPREVKRSGHEAYHTPSILYRGWCVELYLHSPIHPRKVHRDNFNLNKTLKYGFLKKLFDQPVGPSNVRNTVATNLCEGPCTLAWRVNCLFPWQRLSTCRCSQGRRTSYCSHKAITKVRLWRNSVCKWQGKSYFMEICIPVREDTMPSGIVRS